MYNAKELISQAFDACDKRVFAFKANPCQSDVILYSRARKAVNIAARKSNANLTELMLLTYIIDKARKINIDGQAYIYSYEARWDSADTLSCHFGTEARYTKRVLKNAHTKMLICSNGIQGRKKREYRLGDLVIDIAKMTDDELSKFDYASYLTQKESVKKAKLWKTLISRVSKWRQNVQCPGKTLYQCPQETLYQCPQETLEVTKEENKLELNTSGQTYPQAQSDITQHIDNDNQGEDDQQSCSIDFESKKKKTKKRDVIKEKIEEVGRREAASLERYINVIGTIAGVSPLLGLLGTVSGMIKSFNIISLQGVADPASLAGGISEALITTAAGLSVAIPSLMFYRYFRGKVEELVVIMEQEAIKLVEVMHGDRTTVEGGDGKGSAK